MTRNIYGTYIDSSIDNPLILKQEITIILLNIYFLSLKDNKNISKSFSGIYNGSN